MIKKMDQRIIYPKFWHLQHIAWSSATVYTTIKMYLSESVKGTTQ